MNKIRELREGKKMTQMELAAMLNVSQATLSNWERGVHDLDNESLAQLSRFFDCSMDYLLSHSEKRHADDVERREENPLEDAYFRLALEAKNSGVSPGDLKMALDLIKGARERDADFARDRGNNKK